MGVVLGLKCKSCGYKDELWFGPGALGWAVSEDNYLYERLQPESKHLTPKESKRIIEEVKQALSQKDAYGSDGRKSVYYCESCNRLYKLYHFVVKCPPENIYDENVIYTPTYRCIKCHSSLDLVDEKINFNKHSVRIYNKEHKLIDYKCPICGGITCHDGEADLLFD